jgi:4-aminobutyrate aminotransferase-like enzyme
MGLALSRAQRLSYADLGGTTMNAPLPNSPAARDVAYHVHPQTNLRKLRDEGPLIVTRGEGCRIFDETGKDYIEAAAVPSSGWPRVSW